MKDNNTLIENLKNDNLIKIKEDDIELKEENLSKIVIDLSIEQDTRVKAFEKYFTIYDNDSIELMSQITGMYQFSGSKIIQNFLIALCFESNISSFLKLEAAKSLLSFYEMEEVFKKDDDKNAIEIKTESNKQIIKRNNKRKEKGYHVLNQVCKNLSNISTPCKIEAVCSLMDCEKYNFESDEYFRNIINDSQIDCDYRYKSILSLENKANIDSKFFMKNAFLDFLLNIKNRTMYRILSAQYLLQKYDFDVEINGMIEDIVLTFAEDNLLDYNLRADASDLLLNLGSEKVKKRALEIIEILGSVEGNVKTIFQNAQNVHTKEIEKSVAEIIEFLSLYPTHAINNGNVERQEIDFEYISSQIKNMLKEEFVELNHSVSTDCHNYLVNNELIQQQDNKKFCSLECEKQFNKHNKIKLSLNRIYMDRALYSKFNNSLINILIKIWSYICANEYENEMKIRLLQELEDMSGTCSSGFCSRLVNVISGFGELSVRISFEDQIISNFTGRLNTLARRICDHDSPFYTDKLNDVIELYLNSNLCEKKKIIKNLSKTEKLTELPPMKKIIEEYLKTDREEKINNCIEDFSENVINEMTIESQKFANRQNFLLFFRTHMLAIREEMYEEFKNHITDTEFDLWIRKAITLYEGVDFLI
jgi:hypothetical protein